MKLQNASIHPKAMHPTPTSNMIFKDTNSTPENKLKGDKTQIQSPANIRKIIDSASSNFPTNRLNACGAIGRFGLRRFFTRFSSDKDLTAPAWNFQREIQTLPIINLLPV
jgi:hypothetical protein